MIRRRMRYDFVSSGTLNSAQSVIKRYLRLATWMKQVQSLVYRTADVNGKACEAATIGASSLQCCVLWSMASGCSGCAYGSRALQAALHVAGLLASAHLLRLLGWQNEPWKTSRFAVYLWVGAAMQLARGHHGSTCRPQTDRRAPLECTGRRSSHSSAYRAAAVDADADVLIRGASLVCLSSVIAPANHSLPQSGY